MIYWPAMVIIILAELMQKYNFPYTKPDFFFFFVNSRYVHFAFGPFIKKVERTLF